MNTREFITRISATPEERDVLEIYTSSRPVKKLEGLYPTPREVLRSPYLENSYIWNALLRDFSRDHYTFRPYVKALKGFHPDDPKGVRALEFMMALSLEIDEPLVEHRVLYGFRKAFDFNTMEGFGLYCYLLYFSFPMEEFPGIKGYERYTKMIMDASPFSHNPEQFSLIQFLFQGNPLKIGKGDSGGLSTFLMQLGDALTCSMEISQVFTLSLVDISSETCSFQLVRDLGNQHYSIAVPFHVGEDPGFLKSRGFLKAMISLVLKKLRLNPNIYHIRYLNDASLAMANLGRENKRSVVLTLTPDPHRSMMHEESRRIIGHGYEEGIEKIHKTETGKKLLKAAGGILGIGGADGEKRLIRYFPQISRLPRNKPFQMISEGIDIHLPTNRRLDVKKFLTSSNHRTAIDPDNLGKPYLFNVGRLHPMKGQTRLLEAFCRSGAYRTYNLVLIGGNVESPNEGEKEFLGFEKRFLKEHPEIRGSYLHVPGIPNTTVRLIERTINELSTSTLPNLYFCSSRKEEFGIAILEAMVEGFVAFGPKAGGVATYLRHRENGFIGETGTVEDLVGNLQEIITYFGENPHRAVEMKESSMKTIKENYSMRGISTKFVEFYREVLSYEED